MNANRRSTRTSELTPGFFSGPNPVLLEDEIRPLTTCIRRLDYSLLTRSRKMGTWVQAETPMSKKKRTKLVHEGSYVAEVDVELLAEQFPLPPVFRALILNGSASAEVSGHRREIRKYDSQEPFAKFARKRDLLSGRVVVPGSAGVPPAQDLAGSWRLASQGWSVHPPTDAGAAP